EKYATWDWNWGRSPAFDMRKSRRYPFGGVDVFLGVKNGVIQTCQISGDFFGNGDVEDLCDKLTGVPLEQQALAHALAPVDVGSYILGMDAPTMAELLLY
ncbi:lipoate--protein ligase, partial [Clostridia bacterium OttesenSCG-928-O13]|nr:lipoate--protein ligase [Clostridia bacterium OttesenSCG-928-O13]